MKLIKNIFYVFFILLFCTTCKKKTTITVKVFNPALNEYVAGAVVSLFEIKSVSNLSNFIGKNGSCNEIATATTDANGIATFDKEKLRTGYKYKYKCGIKESWGIVHRNSCGSANQDYLDVGKTQEIQLSDYMEIQYKVERNSSLLNPSMSGDTLRADIAPMVYYDPMVGHTQGGGGTTIILTYDNNYPITTTVYGQTTTIFANRLVVTTRKRKMGVVSVTVDTVRAYPSDGVTIVKLNW